VENSDRAGDDQEYRRRAIGAPSALAVKQSVRLPTRRTRWPCTTFNSSPELRVWLRDTLASPARPSDSGHHRAHGTARAGECATGSSAAPEPSRQMASVSSLTFQGRPLFQRSCRPPAARGRAGDSRPQRGLFAAGVRDPQRLGELRAGEPSRLTFGIRATRWRGASSARIARGVSVRRSARRVAGRGIHTRRASAPPQSLHHGAGGSAQFHSPASTATLRALESADASN
jgi:hypothetical protein